MMNAKTLDLLADKQYGSQWNKAAILQCLNKGIFYNILQQWKRPVALCSNDAKSCYNCITLLAAVLSLCRLGALIPTVQSMVKMIHRMQHHICTAYSNSQQAASQKNWDQLIAGIGQGNGAAPNLGSGQLSYVQYNVSRWVSCTGDRSYLTAAMTDCGFHICWQHRSMHDSSIRQGSASGSANAMGHNPLGRFT